MREAATRGADVRVVATLSAVSVGAVLLYILYMKGLAPDPWTLPSADSSGTGAGTGYPPPRDPCLYMKKRLANIEAEIRDIRQIIKQNENAGFMTDDLSDELHMWEGKRDRTIKGLDKRCPGWQ